MLHDIGGAELGVRALVPADVERGQALLGRPHVIGDHRHGVVEAHHLVHALDRLRLAVIDAGELAAEYGQAATVAIFIPGTFTSMLNWALPLTLSWLSRRLAGVPISLKSFGSLSATWSGTGKVAALSTRAP